MSRIHVCERDGGRYRIVLHIPVPDEENAAGIKLCDAIYHCRHYPNRGRTWTQFALDMAGNRTDIDAVEQLEQWGHSESGAPEKLMVSPEETNELCKGHKVEIVRFEQLPDDVEAAKAVLETIYAREAPRATEAVRKKFRYFGLLE